MALDIDQWADNAIQRPAELSDFYGISRDELDRKMGAICIAAALHNDYYYVSTYLDEYKRITVYLN